MQLLNLRQIEVFRAVMITGSINGAAQLLYVSQPAVSRMLSHTEARIGFQLFERVKGWLYPSPEARCYPVLQDMVLLISVNLRHNQFADRAIVRAGDYAGFPVGDTAAYKRRMSG